METSIQHGVRGIALSLVLLLAACGSKITPENYDKIKNGMTKDEVYSIIGAPTDVSSAGIGALTASSEAWKSDEHTITITFANDKVRFKAIGATEATSK